MPPDLSKLSSLEVDLLSRRMAGESLANAAQRLGISRLRVRKIENEAMRKAWKAAWRP